MSNTNNGGPAFPRPASATAVNGPQAGMTLRDYFAAKAMQGLMDAAMPMPEMADAMLRARDGGAA